MPEISTMNDRLDSWKEIATYLKRNERTVIRWESRGLPVHRVPGGHRHTVFAYKHELDAWLQQVEKSVDKDEGHTADLPSEADVKPEENLPAHSADIPVPKGQPHLSSVRLTRVHYKKLLIICISIIVLCGVAGITLVLSHAPAHPSEFNFAKLTDDGRDKLNLRTSSTMLYFNEFEGIRETLMALSVSSGQPRPINTPFLNVDLQDISNDGQSLLVTSFQGIERERPLWIIGAYGEAPRRVGDAFCNFARWSPDNRKIACAGGTTIVVLDSDGSGSKFVGSFPLRPSRLAWTPDGERLRFVLEDDMAKTLSPWEIAIRGDGSATLPTPLKASLGENCCVDWDWKKDGKDFVFAKLDVDGKLGIFLKSALLDQANRETKLPVKIGHVRGIAASRTGDALYLLIENAVHAASYRGELLQFDPKQKAFPAILHGLSASYLSFSRDGQWMTYMSTLDTSLWRSRVDGTEALQLTKPPLEAEMSSWSPDGRQIAFMARAPGKPWRIYLISRNGGDAKEATLGEDSQGAPTWSPDGKALVYGNVWCEETQNCWVRRVDLATKRVEIIPDSHGFRTARWSPDGKYIAALQRETHELKLFDVKIRRWSTITDGITGDDLNWSSDSQSIYAESPRDEKPVIERIQVKDGRRTTVVNLTSLQNIPNQLDRWFGLTPNNLPILLYRFTASEVYALNWTDR
jgi:Tol biopolymer transport system component